jgi:hypothetical protein
MPCGDQVVTDIDGMLKKEHYEMYAYQKSGDNMLIKGKLFLNSITPLAQKVSDTSKVEIFVGTDLNNQTLLIIRETTESVLKKNKEKVVIENCDLYVTRISPNVRNVIAQLLLDKSQK